MKSQQIIEFDASLVTATNKDGNDVCIRFERTTTCSYENYGADADGNRGQLRLTLDNDEFDDVHVMYYDGTNVLHKLSDLSAEEQEEVTRLIEEYMEMHDAEFDESEPDYDDREEDE